MTRKKKTLDVANLEFTVRNCLDSWYVSHREGRRLRLIADIRFGESLEKLRVQTEVQDPDFAFATHVAATTGLDLSTVSRLLAIGRRHEALAAAVDSGFAVYNADAVGRLAALDDPEFDKVLKLAIDCKTGRDLRDLLAAQRTPRVSAQKVPTVADKEVKETPVVIEQPRVVRAEKEPPAVIEQPRVTRVEKESVDDRIEAAVDLFRAHLSDAYLNTFDGDLDAMAESIERYVAGVVRRSKLHSIAESAA